ncbi:hypothetical protein N658DRAFT_220979 [Parathielavia hyrcaniae]|uniref:Uncharacterized protein n=1 Tax=Parathielavia hyrcaniae TaxID=113614 RepID=A0AAN6SZI7_9PEZI|nr:hypothetical protein N658DRAFT_220979 [Parathielavia hyrcaniae]
MPRVMETIMRHVYSSPGMRARFVRHGEGILRVELRPGLTFEDEPFLWLVDLGHRHSTLGERYNYCSAPMLPLEDIFIEIYRAAEERQKRENDLSPLALDTIAEAALWADVQSRLTSWRPRIFSPFHRLGFEKTCGGKMKLVVGLWADKTHDSRK